MHPIVYILIAIVGVIALWAALAYNRFVKLRQRGKEAWADIDVQLKRRYNLIPNLLETVKGYARHEKEVFEKVTQARAAATNAGEVKDQAQAENMLSGALKSLFAVAENYPELKASANFIELQKELTDTEDKIQAARRFYNRNARDYNIRRESFPDSFVARKFNFQKMDLFEINDEKVRQVPKVDFSS